MVDIGVASSVFGGKVNAQSHVCPNMKFVEFIFVITGCVPLKRCRQRILWVALSKLSKFSARGHDSRKQSEAAQPLCSDASGDTATNAAR